MIHTFTRELKSNGQSRYYSLPVKDTCNYSASQRPREKGLICEEFLQRPQAVRAHFVPNLVFTIGDVCPGSLQDTYGFPGAFHVDSFIFGSMGHKIRLAFQWTL